MADRDPLPPIEPNAGQEGGGTPNPDAPMVGGTQISRGADFVQAISSLTATLEAVAPAVESEPLAVTWNGFPTKAALSALRRESWCPGFDAEQAALVLSGMWEGSTLVKLCMTPGYPKRSVVMAWAKLVPEFGEMLAEARTALGEYQVDLAEAEDDPARMRSRLAVAAAFDRTIAKGEGEVVAQAGITVTVNRFESGGA